MRNGLLQKTATPAGAPVWMKIPGTPFTLPGSPTQHERLPGMTQWAPRSMLERMAAGLEKNRSTSELIEEEGQRGLGGSVGIGAVAGGTGGALLGRLFSGQAGTKPLVDIGKKGLNRNTFSALKNIPLAMKALPLLGLGAGAYLGKKRWDQGKEQREETAEQSARGLLTEQVLQQSNILNAAQNVQQQAPPLLNQLKHESAHQAPPYVATTSSMGV